MQALIFPFHIDPQGHMSVATTYEQIVRGQIIDVLMTNFPERVMRPNYGSDLRSAQFDPVDELMTSDAEQQIRERLNTWCPRALLQSVTLKTDDLRPSTIFVDVVYRVGPYEQATTLRVPVARFLDEESEI